MIDCAPHHEGRSVALHHILVLAIVQGITEFLPVSSSGHLILIGKMTDWPDQGLAMDVAVHVGSLLAVMVYFAGDVWRMLIGVGRIVTGRGGENAYLLVNVIVATLPIVAAGYFLLDHVATWFRDPAIVAWATIGFGILLWVADKVGMTIRRVEHLRLPSAIAIGIMQVLALIPGTSRSGITMTAGRFLGMERAEAARFSMLLSMPTIIAAGGLIGWDIYRAGNLAVTTDMGIAAGMSFVAALISITVMMSLLKRTGFGIFVLYRIALGCGLLYWIHAGGQIL